MTFAHTYLGNSVSQKHSIGSAAEGIKGVQTKTNDFA
jgi:hypothetical protein